MLLSFYGFQAHRFRSSECKTRVEGHPCPISETRSGYVMPFADLCQSHTRDAPFLCQTPNRPRPNLLIKLLPRQTKRLNIHRYSQPSSSELINSSPPCCEDTKTESLVKSNDAFQTETRKHLNLSPVFTYLW